MITVWVAVWTITNDEGATTQKLEAYATLDRFIQEYERRESAERAETIPHKIDQAQRAIPHWQTKVDSDPSAEWAADLLRRAKEQLSMYSQMLPLEWEYVYSDGEIIAAEPKYAFLDDLVKIERYQVKE